MAESSRQSCAIFYILYRRHIRKTMVKWQKFAPTGNMIIDLLGRNSAKKNFPPAVKASELLSTRPWLNTQWIITEFFSNSPAHTDIGLELIFRIQAGPRRSSSKKSPPPRGWEVRYAVTSLVESEKKIWSQVIQTQLERTKFKQKLCKSYLLWNPVY